MGSWQQVYDPLHSWPLSTLVSILPLATFFYVLLGLKKHVWKAALSALLAAVGLALAVFRMPPALTGGAALLGTLIGWLRIAWILIASVYLYNIAVATGQFDFMRKSIARLTPDRRLQAIVVAFCFGAFLEGSGGGGAPVAVTGALLVGLGFEPLQAAKICLLTNTMPLAWGGIGNATGVLAASTGVPEQAISAAMGRILPLLTILLPFWLVAAMTGWRRAREVLPAALLSGVTFALIQRLMSMGNYTAWIDVTASAGTLAVVAGFLRIWRPPSILPCGDGALPGFVPEAKPSSAPAEASFTAGSIAKGWSSVLFILVLMIISGIPAVSRMLSVPVLSHPLPALESRVVQVPPMAPKPVPAPPIPDLSLVVWHGVAIFAGATISGMMLGLSLRRALKIFVQIVARLAYPLLGVTFMVGFLFVYRYSGMIAVMGLALTRTGPAFPFFGTFLGWLGVTLSGMDAVSDSLFGHLQTTTALRHGLSPVLTAAASASGGVMGRMMDPQSILVSATATQQSGKEGAIFKTVFKHSLMMTSFLGLVVVIYAFLLPGVLLRR